MRVVEGEGIYLRGRREAHFSPCSFKNNSGGGGRGGCGDSDQGE